MTQRYNYFLQFSITFILLIFANNSIFSQAPGCPYVNAGVDQTIACGSCTNLTATALQTGATTSYAVSSVAYTPPYPYNSGSAIMVGSDDIWSGLINLPFNFCFFGTSYNKIVVGANGIVSFAAANAGAYCAWSYTASCPNSAICGTSSGPYIMGPFHDIDPAVGGSIYNSTVLGTYPCRTFVVNYYQVPMYSSACNSMKATHQIVLYEGTNVIEVYIQSALLCSTWNAGNKCIGIQNAAGTVGYSPPGRNTGAWSAANEAWRFTPNGTPNYTLAWYQGATLIGSTATINVCPATTTTYTAQVTYTNCDGAQYTDQDQMVVNLSTPIVTVSPTASTVCSGTPVTITASGATTYSWSNGASGSSITVSPTSNTTYTVTGTSSGCSNTASSTITVNSGPPVSAGLPQTICTGNSATLTATGATTYSWNTGSLNPSITVSPAITTIYTVTGTTAGCTASSNITVTVASGVTANAGVDQTICNGETAVLSASGGATYLWSNGGGTASVSVTPSSTSTYIVTAYSGGCSGTDNITVNVNPIPTANAGIDQTICEGQSATLTATGGSTYSWSTGGSTNSIIVNPTSATTYTVTAYSSGCSDSDDITVNVNPVPIVSSGSGQTICPGNSATLTASGATSYLWSTGSTNTSITVSPATTTIYSVTGTSSGCSASSSVGVSIGSNITADAGSNQTICVGQSVSLSATGGTTFAWSNGGGTQNISVSPLTTTTYIVTVSAAGCSGTDNVTINVNQLPSANAGTDQIICQGQSANLTAFGGISYSWSNSAQTQSTNVSPASTSTYIVTVTDANTCSNTDDIQVTVNPLPIPNAGPDKAICSGSSTTFNASGGNDYVWSPGTGLNNTNIFNPTADPSVTTNYTVTVTDINGCTASDLMILTVNNLPNANAGNDVSICQGQSTSLSASGGTIYNWSPSAGLSNASISSPSANPANTTTYIVTVTDANSCSNSDNITVTVNPNPTSTFTATNAICVGSDATVTYTGTASTGATYTWDFDGATIISGSGQGPYQISWANPATYNISLSVSENGCNSSSTTVPVIVDRVVATISVTNNISCYGLSDGAVSVSQTGTIPFIYTWNPVPAGSAGQTATGMSPNIQYTVTVTDNYGCNDVKSITLTEPQLLTLSVSTQDALCYGDHNGSASTTVNGGTPTYDYSWSPSGTAGNVPNVNNLAANNYSLTVTDQNGCIATNNFNISQSPLLTYTFTSQNITCNSGSDGSISIDPSGGNSTYAYIWSPLISTDSFASGLSANTYNIVITDHNGCDTSLSITLSQPDPIVLSTTGNVSICLGQSTVIGANATGGSGSYQFTWDNGLGNGNSFTVTPSVTTTYTVNVSDVNGCTASSQTLTVSVSPTISVTLTALPTAICLGDNTVLTASATGGNGNYTYTWDNSIGVSGSQQTVNPSQTTTYIVTVTDNCNSPQGTDDITVIVNPLPTVSFSADDTEGCAPVSVIFTDNSNPTIQSWNWNFGDPNSGINNTSTLNNPAHVFTAPGSYSISLNVTTNNGCSGSLTTPNMIEVYPVPDAAFTLYPPTGSTQNPTIYFDNYSSNTAFWNWNFGDPSSTTNTSSDPDPQHTYESYGTYTIWLIVESAYGCIDSTSENVFIKQDFTLFFPNAFTPNGDGDNDGFRPEGDGVDLNHFELYIFDRWGSEVFRTNDFYQPWNGKVQNSEKYAEVAVYTWICNVRDVNGEMYMFNGRVTLVR